MSKTINTRSGKSVVLPTGEEEAAINRGIAQDPGNPEMTAEEFSRLRPFSELLAEKRMGRPPKERPKEQVTLRYDAEVIEAFRATGRGWQTRMNDALKDWLKTHSSI